MDFTKTLAALASWAATRPLPDIYGVMIDTDAPYDRTTYRARFQLDRDVAPFSAFRVFADALAPNEEHRPDLVVDARHEDIYLTMAGHTDGVRIEAFARVAPAVGQAVLARPDVWPSVPEDAPQVPQLVVPYAVLVALASEEEVASALHEIEGAAAESPAGEA